MAQKAGKSKAKDKRPARLRYWLRRGLEKNKVRRLVKYGGMEPDEALKYWQAVRKVRIPKGFNHAG